MGDASFRFAQGAPPANAASLRNRAQLDSAGGRATEPTLGRVLVVDDDSGARSALGALLSADGFLTSTAADGEAALAEARRAPPDIVLTDLQMPGMDGVDLCRRLHEIDPDLPVIIMTAHSDMQSVIESLRAGAEDYLVKPLVSEAVLWCVQRALARRAARREQARLLRALNERLVLSSIREQAHGEAEALHNAQLNALLANLSEGVIIADPSGRIIMINEAARAILGFWDEAPSLDALNALGALNLEGRSLSREERPLSLALSGKQFMDYEVLRLRPDGERRRVAFMGTSVKDPEGNVALAIVVFRDVTELRRLELQRDEHLALISHDLRNPLSTMLMAFSLLKDSAEKEKQGGQRLPLGLWVNMVDRAERNAQRMSGMLEELMEAKNLESQGVALSHEPCDLRELVSNAIDSLDDTRARRITIEAEEASTYLVLGDASRLERVVTNLLTNALKYSADDARVIARLGHEGSSLTFDVIDDGIGIAPESVKMLFERYYRTSASKAHASGLGLGLYITRLIVEAHGGKVAVSSDPDRGSTFRVILPSHVR